MESEKKLEPSELLALYGIYDAAQVTADMAETMQINGHESAEKWKAIASRRLADAVSDADALEINVFLASSLLADRFAIVRRLREQDPPMPWSKIGGMLGMTKQSAHEWFAGGNIRPRADNPTEHA
ncbi:hypothetical protein [Rhodococcus sp. H29-C3]|uniref:hypothetical protein n=1 Tax=Rhodococcus sp. H29-C3 TaxID=3046307 RepID=UPI0024B9EBD6|nr:hypothetical protein [Rhodococcus sp. H29-C3]MDJ0363112.1 hypothetical protein [Rhodococcus sp. H29-C3]